ncbi:hypothetical protein [Acidomonas methanolica]|uniref:Uncharacterized protein n=1 Tax=Acidomonas methanolica NBRC 104435 TaxID=1231351 RepID=A0A023D8I8_ACIMT|nr:hypothetical protein [Acidomonas methanolica]MBU2654779.1 hypothetical protein [Acidomonas methanolica]TCS26363.1 hypothetical protein EDC31_1145 [Acidomonas methanolica]GAJ30414.1 hypothetical protein Amme_134_006 [Acidomonas methanolica NBRC 104435]GBQ57472.1 hypothetical protein AA0498_2521 [Acidomonas methanolica]GEL00519.1 hypothetical protein AME01nite_30170 [Acidomonas methanolica NBRC 104435]
MTEPLSLARFAELAETYGALARWPQAERDAGREMADTPEAAAFLARAAALDDLLDQWAVAPPDASLREAIMAGHLRPLRRRIRVWWSAVGLASALAGAVAGVLVVEADPAGYHATEDTAFGSLVVQEK